MSAALPASWSSLLPDSEVAKLSTLVAMLSAVEDQVVLPYDKTHWFRAFTEVSPADCKLVVLGQDPYPNRSDAMGLAFSVPDHIKLPRSLVNIYKELVSDLGIQPPANGNLLPWVQQGVLLANTALTVVEGNAGAHAKLWSAFTQQWVKSLGNDGRPRVWLLWGGHAQKFRGLLGENQVVIESVHPSPLSARRGFFGSKPFSKVNEALAGLGHAPILWA